MYFDVVVGANGIENWTKLWLIFMNDYGDDIKKRLNCVYDWYDFMKMRYVNMVRLLQMLALDNL